MQSLFLFCVVDGFVRIAVRIQMPVSHRGPLLNNYGHRLTLTTLSPNCGATVAIRLAVRLTFNTTRTTHPFPFPSDRFDSLVEG